MTSSALPIEPDRELVRVNAPQPFFRGFGAAVRDVIRYRELLTNLVRKELKVKYKDSVLGFLWSLLRPMFLLAIYYIVIGKFLGSSIPYFAIYLFSGLVAWDLFSAVLGGSATAIVNNAALVKKVYFPREILPLSVAGAAIVHFFLQLVVLFAALLAFRYNFFGPNLLYLPLAFLVLVVFMTGCGLLLAAVNVYLRDTQHLLEVFLLFWFWMTPIVYPINFALTKLSQRSKALEFLYMLNPMTNIVSGFHRAIYRHIHVAGNQVLYGGPILERLAVVLVGSLILLWLSQRVFARAQGNFAQEL
jgi:ABC-2 type transport system permease protein